MKKIDISRPTITELLDEFSHDFLPDAKVGTRKRYQLVRGHLGRYLEAEGHRFLTSSSLRILIAEHEMDPIDAFVRTMHADDLFYALPHYLAPEHALEPALERRAQLDVIVNLCSWMRERRFVDERTIDECIILDVNYAVKEGREALRSEARQPRF